MPLKLTGLSFKASPQSPLSIAPVTLLVGPNNSGKSLTLREIEAWAKGEDKEYKIVDTIEVEWPHTVVEARELLHPAIMCSEALWWRCHRRLVADRLVTEGVQVLHIGSNGKTSAHELTDFAEIDSQGEITYPAEEPRV